MIIVYAIKMNDLKKIWRVNKYINWPPKCYSKHMNQSIIYDSPQADSIAKLLQQGKIDAYIFDIFSIPRSIWYEKSLSRKTMQLESM